MGLAGDADVAELVDALDLGSSAERRVGSTPIIRTSFSISHQFASLTAKKGRPKLRLAVALCERCGLEPFNKAAPHRASCRRPSGP